MLFRSTTPADADELLALVHACDVVAVGFPDYDMSEVEHALKGEFTTVAHEPGGRILGWTFVESSSDQRDWLDVYVHPELGLQARRPLLAKALEHIRQRGKPVRSGAVPTETDWIAALEESGFTFLKQHARMGIDLPAAVTPVAGVEVRPVRQEELPHFHRLMESAFLDAGDHNTRTYEQWLARWVDDQTVHWDEWLVAFVDGTLAGALQSKAGDEGWVQNLGVLREFRRRKVATALLGEAFRIYAAKGYPTAGLGVDLTNPTQAIKLYTGVGMAPAYRANIYGLEPVGAAGPGA
jgi:ribosomal protein S18 acetylase RimI-like enzyme